MANKQYISIIRLFDHCGISTNDDFNLSRVKKQLQAEFGIAQGGFIEIDGYTYTRHDVFEEIEAPDFAKRLVYHKKIWTSPQILDLLENSAADLIEINNEFRPLLGNKEFDEFFSPYFVGPFNYISRTLIADLKLRDLGNLFAYEDFLQPAEREEAFRSVRVFLDENIRLLRNVNKENYDIMRPKILHWIDGDWHIFFNNLPHEFYEIKNDITTYIINIGVAVQRSHKYDCRQMSEQLIDLHDMPASLRDIIVSNHAVYTKATAPPVSSDGSVNWRAIFWIGWVVFMFFRAADGCDSKSSYQYKPIFPTDYNQYRVTDSTFKSLYDSTSKRRNDSLFRRIDSILKMQKQ